MQAIAQRRSRTVAAGRRSTGAPVNGFRSIKSRSGQSLIEACIVVAILCLVLFGSVQRSQMFLAQEVLNRAAYCGARARAVGFNDFMVQKTIRVAAIPVAGQLVQPIYAGDPNSPILGKGHISGAWNTALKYRGQMGQTSIEKNYIPYYLGAGDWGSAAGYLDYQLDYLNQYGWTADGGGKPTKSPNIQRSVRLQDLVSTSISEDAASVTVTVKHEYPLNYALHRALFSGVDSLPMQGTATVERHYDLYLQ